MAFLTREQSDFDGEPIEFYQFTTGGAVHTYAAGDVNVTYNDVIYPAAQIENQGIVTGMERELTEMLISMPRDLAVAQQFIQTLPPYQTEVKVFRQHKGDAEVRSWWVGYVVAVNFQQNAVEMRAVPLYLIYTRPGVRRLFQPLCNHMLYDPDTCRVDPNAYKATGIITAISTNVLTSTTFAAQADGYYTSGFVRQISTGDLRFIVNHVGPNITLWAPFHGLVEFDSVDVYAGCDHSDTVCDTKFGNLVNNGSWPLVPLINPTQKEFT